jgi:hypothetical protein
MLIPTVPLPQTPFETTKILPKIVTSSQYTLPQANSLLIKRKHLRMSKHSFTFKKPTTPNSINPLEFKRIEKPKEVIKKTKLLNKNSKILEFLFDNNNNNNNNNNNTNNNNNVQDIFDLVNIEYSTPPILLPQIIALDSQTIVLNSVSSFYSFLIVINNPSLNSPPINSLIVDSNASTQALNILEVFKLISIPPLSPISIEETNYTTTNIISVTLQKN